MMLKRNRNFLNLCKRGTTAKQINEMFITGMQPPALPSRSGAMGPRPSRIRSRPSGRSSHSFKQWLIRASATPLSSRSMNKLFPRHPRSGKRRLQPQYLPYLKKYGQNHRMRRAKLRSMTTKSMTINLHSDCRNAQRRSWLPRCLQ